MKPVYTLHAGRTISRDEKPFTYLANCGGYSPCELDAFAHAVVLAVNEREGLLKAARLAKAAFVSLANVAGDVPEWNCGGIGYEASQAVKAALAKAKGRRHHDTK